MKKDDIAQAFSDPSAVANYAQGPLRLVPGFLDLQRMTSLLLAEFAPANAKILVVGAGGGLELKVFAEAHDTWSFEGVDPSKEMLDLARLTLGDLKSRVQFCEGYINDASEGPFDGATCLLTLHFLEKEDRLQTLKEIHKRLKPGAPFIAAHHSISNSNGEMKHWLDRFAAYAISSGIEPERALSTASALSEKLPILSPQEDRELLSEAGFKNVALFYAGFTFRGWVARA